MPNDSRPVPDPTKLTTDQLLREISSLRELMEARMDGRDHLTDERLRSGQEALGKVEQLANSERHNLNTRIDDLKERLDRGDGGAQKSEKMGSFVFSVIAAILSFIGISIALLAIFLK